MTDRAIHPQPADVQANESTEPPAESILAWAPSDWTIGKTFGEMYLDGELPWPEEPLLQNDRHSFEVVDEYLSILSQYTRAEQDSDPLALRRLSGELHVAEAALAHMDTYSQAAGLTRLTGHLTRAAQQPAAPSPRTHKRVQVLPEQGRFKGPAPFFRRGRAYIQALAPTFILAAEGHGDFVSCRPDRADQFLRAVEASDDVTELQDFIAGAVHELHRQLRQLVAQPTNGDR